MEALEKNDCSFCGIGLSCKIILLSPWPQPGEDCPYRTIESQAEAHEKQCNNLIDHYEKMKVNQDSMLEEAYQKIKELLDYLTPEPGWISVDDKSELFDLLTKAFEHIETFGPNDVFSSLGRFNLLWRINRFIDPESDKYKEFTKPLPEKPVCPDCGDDGYTVEPEHHHDCHPSEGCVAGCPVPTQVQCPCQNSPESQGEEE